MSSTPKTKLKKVNDQHDTKTSTPKQAQRVLALERDYSPVFLPCTQESMDDLDVKWDWNSPQSRTNYTRKTKRPQKLTSPKLPLKKNALESNLRAFDKLKEELQAFREEINVDENDTADNEPVVDKHSADLEEFFNDSIEQDMVLASQLIEHKLEIRNATPIKQTVDFKLKDHLDNLGDASPIFSKARASPRNLMTKSFSSNELESPVRKMEKSRFNFKSRFKEMGEGSFNRNDSIDMACEAFNEDEHLELSTKSAEVTSECDKSVKEQSVSMLKLKTKSLSFGDHYTNTRSTQNIATKAEIERKRMEALAKLRAKKKPEYSDSDTSPIKCSPEEIALKRQQALAKLEAKKQQDVIERNRQEALKRLEMNRKKRAEGKR